MQVYECIGEEWKSRTPDILGDNVIVKFNDTVSDNVDLVVLNNPAQI
jgi:hypothetical protein